MRLAIKGTETCGDEIGNQCPSVPSSSDESCNQSQAAAMRVAISAHQSQAAAMRFAQTVAPSAATWHPQPCGIHKQLTVNVALADCERGPGWACATCGCCGGLQGRGKAAVVAEGTSGHASSR